MGDHSVQVEPLCSNNYRLHSLEFWLFHMPLYGDLDTVLIKVKLDSIIDHVSCGGQRHKTIVGCCLVSMKLCSKMAILNNQGHRDGIGWQAVIANSLSSDLGFGAKIPTFPVQRPSAHQVQSSSDVLEREREREKRL